MQKLHIAILAGGKGTRLFPLSKEFFPKQFIKLIDKLSLFQHTILRIYPEIPSQNIFIVTNEQFKFIIEQQLKELNIKIPKENIILEPISKNTAPAIGLVAKFFIEKLKKEFVPLYVLPSDHFLYPKEKFLKILQKGLQAIYKNNLVTLGIKPMYPSTEYGYIEIGHEILSGIYQVKKFHEKPSEDIAKLYLQQGNFFWNSGIFGFTPRKILEEFKKYASEIYKLLSNHSFEEIKRNYDKFPNISIDYAIFEKTKDAVVIPAEFKWNDLGSWNALFDFFPKDKNLNVNKGKNFLFETKKSLIWSEQKPIITLGIEETVIVETDNVVLVANKNSLGKFKQVLNDIKKHDPELLKYGNVVFKPWGFYQVLEENSKYKIKKIVVNPGEALSMQMHFHRSEHWIVVKGTAKVILETEDGNLKEVFLKENESIFVPKTKKHRLENPGKIPLEIIEVQVGEYLGEDDIIRFYDNYNRK
jgi:mannose-1-phosphate guanylyltransferase/mannose-6-phosphate isomerase